MPTDSFPNPIHPNQLETAERLDEIDADVAKELGEIVERGLAAPFPDPADGGGEFK